MKRLFAMLLTVTLLLSGCGMLEDFSGWDLPGPDSNPPTTSETTYYNGYTGVSVTIPAGYYVSYLSEINLTSSREESSNLNLLERFDYEDGGCSIDLASFASARDSGEDEHCEMDLFIDEYVGYFSTVEEYVAYLAESAIYSEGGFERTFVSGGSAQVNGVHFQTLSYEVYHPDNGTSIIIEDYYVAQVGGREDGLYLVAYVNYWADNRRSIDTARYMVENCFALEHSVQGSGSVVVV